MPSQADDHKCASAHKFPEGDPVEVRPPDSLAKSQAGLNGPSGSPTSPSGRESKCAAGTEPTLVTLIDGLAGLGGVHIRVRHELPEASMRLMATLGAVVEIDPDAPDCARTNGWAGEHSRCRGCARVDREQRG